MNITKDLVKLYAHLELDASDMSILSDYLHGYLTVNEGRDKKLYFWYCDEIRNCAIQIGTSQIIEDEEILDELFY